MKRAISPPEQTVSPPPVKRKVESTTTNKAIASFFTPTSKKQPEKFSWRIVDQTLVIGQNDQHSQKSKALTHPVKIASFDLDDTIIVPTENRWTKSATSWKWWDTCVPGRLKKLYEEGYVVVIFSNQGNVNLKDNSKSLQKDSLSLSNFKDQIVSICQQLNFPINIYAATGQDLHRKPRIGMWKQMLEDYDLQENTIDKSASFYVGDAAGRDGTAKRRKDHAVSDRNLAANIGIKFHTPEEFFLQAESEPYRQLFDPVEFLEEVEKSKTLASTDPIFSRKNTQEMVIFCGSPGAGKSTFYWNSLQPLGYERVNQDILKTRDRCIKKAKEYLMAGLSVAVDNTNADVATRAYWVQLAREFKLPIRCVNFTASTRLCEHNDSVRALNRNLMNPESRVMLPGIAFRSFAQRFVQPFMAEGFQDITEIHFQFKGTSQQQDVWSKHWVSKFST